MEKGCNPLQPFLFMEWLLIPLTVVSDVLPIPQEVQWLVLPGCIFFWALFLWLRRGLKIYWADVWVYVWALLVFFRADFYKEWGSYQQVLSLGMISIPAIVRTASIKKSGLVIFLVYNSLWNLVFILLSLLGKETLFYRISPFNQENHYAFLSYLGWFYGFLFLEKNLLSVRSKRLWSMVTTGIFLSALCMTGAKNVQLGLFCGICCYGVLSRSEYLKNISVRTYISFWGGVILVVLVVFPYVAFKSKYFSGFGESFAARSAIWMASFSLLKEHWLWGIGSGAYWGNIIRYWPSIQEAPYLMTYYPSVAHSHVLHFWCELGILGLVVSLGFLVSGFYSATVVFLREKDPKLLSLMVSLIPVLLFSEVTQAFPSAVLALTAAITYNHVLATREAAYWLKELYRYGWIVLLIALSILPFYEVFMDMRARSHVRDVFLRGMVRLEDYADLKKSLEIYNNSVAQYYSAVLFIQLNMLNEAEKALEQVEQLSDQRWAIDRRKAQIRMKQGKCAEAVGLAKKVLKFRQEKDEPWLIDILKQCQARIPETKRESHLR